jgi:hypothetical protein
LTRVLPAPFCSKMSPMSRCCWTPTISRASDLWWINASRSASRDCGLLDLQVAQVLRYRGRADHLVAKLVSDIRIIGLEGEPALDIGKPGLGQDVADGVAHPRFAETVRL